jgi:hypothetical protein
MLNNENTLPGLEEPPETMPGFPKYKQKLDK